MNKYLSVNVGGQLFRILIERVQLFTECRLAKLSCYENLTRAEILALCDDWYHNGIKNEFYFDRDPQSFAIIVDAFRGRRIHASKSVCLMRLREEMHYWSIDEARLDYNSRLRLERCLTIMEQHEKNMKEKLLQYLRKQQQLEYIFPIKTCKDFKKSAEILRKKMWTHVEDPSSSVIAKFWTFTSVVFILVSLTTFVVGTVPDYYVIDENGIEMEIQSLQTIEKACMIWFTFEYIVRLAVSPKKFAFLKQFLNIIDLLTVIPFFIQLTMTGDSVGSINTWKHLTQMLRIMRVIRVFRLGRHSGGLKLLCVTFKQSTNELIMLTIFLVIGVVVLATLLYTTEDDELFPNLGEAIWFSAVTITTVGYGDSVPASVIGKIITSFSFLLGLFAIAMPIHPIISNFSNEYRVQKDVEDAFKRRLKLIKREQHGEKTKDLKILSAAQLVLKAKEYGNRKNSSVPMKRRATLPLLGTNKQRRRSQLSLHSNPTSNVICNMSMIQLPGIQGTHCSGKTSPSPCHCVFCTE